MGPAGAAETKTMRGPALAAQNHTDGRDTLLDTTPQGLLMADIDGAGRVAQRESTPFTREGSQVQSLSRPPLWPNLHKPCCVRRGVMKRGGPARFELPLGPCHGAAILDCQPCGCCWLEGPPRSRSGWVVRTCNKGDISARRDGRVCDAAECREANTVKPSGAKRS